MKKIILIFVIMPCCVMAMTDNVRLDMLNAQIATLERERVEKYDELKKCEETTKGFKIAGMTTLVATGVGIYANVKLHDKLSRMTGNATNSGAKNDPGRVTISADEQCYKACCGDPDVCDRYAFEDDCHCSQLCDACAA